MNPYWENDKSLTSRTYLQPQGEVTAVASNIICPRQGILESKRMYDGYADMDACRRPNARVKSDPIYLHKCITKESAHGRESAVGKLDSRHSLSTPAISGRPPLQPHSRRRMSGETSSVSVSESHKDPEVGEAHHRGSKRLLQSDSKWNSGCGALTDRPPLQHIIRHEKSNASCASTKEYHKDPLLKERRPESSIRSLQPSDDSRWSSGSRATFDMAPFQALARSSLRSVK
jgi:hypothetical protein